MCKETLNGMGTCGTRSSNGNSIKYTNSNEVDLKTLKIFELHIPWNVPIKYHTNCGWAAAGAATAVVLSSHTENLHKLQSLPYRKRTHS